jgi:uncharacterized protein (DUF3820 family)
MARTLQNVAFIPQEEVTFIADPDAVILTFGKYKGKKLSEVPTSYLSWLLEEARKNGTNSRGITSDITFWADEELKKRGINPTIREQWDKATVTRQQEKAVEAGTTSVSVKNPNPDVTVRFGAREVQANVTHLNDIILVGISQLSQFMLKEFIIRTDRQQGILEWALEFTQEVLKYGVKQDFGKYFEYLNHKFYLYTVGNTPYIRHIEPLCSDETE